MAADRGIRLDHSGDLVGGPVVQEPAEQRPGAAPWQENRHMGAGLAGLLGGEFAGRPFDPPVRAVHQVERNAPVRAVAIAAAGGRLVAGR